MEILIRVVDKEPSGSPRFFKAGDVITIQPDGHPWSERERTSAEWRIVRAPILQTHADTLMAAAVDLIVEQAHPEWTRRRYRINLTHIAVASLLTGPRTQEIINVNTPQGRAALESATEEKP